MQAATARERLPPYRESPRTVRRFQGSKTAGIPARDSAHIQHPDIDFRSERPSVNEEPERMCIANQVARHKDRLICVIDDPVAIHIISLAVVIAVDASDADDIPLPWPDAVGVASNFG
jgi:hypothetical protein